MHTATYVGGPLDGQTVEREGGRWPAYLSEAGGKMTTVAGDRQLWNAQFRPERLSGCYHYREHVNSETLPSTVQRTYVHSSVLAEEFAERRRSGVAENA